MRSSGRVSWKLLESDASTQSARQQAADCTAPTIFPAISYCGLEWKAQCLFVTYGMRHAFQSNSILPKYNWTEFTLGACRSAPTSVDQSCVFHSQWGKLAENIDISQSNQSQLWSQNSQCTVDVYSHKGVIHRLAPTQWCPWNRQALYCMSARHCVRTRQKIWSCYARLLNNKNHLLLVKKLQASRSTCFAKWIRSMVHQKDKN